MAPVLSFRSRARKRRTLRSCILCPASGARHSGLPRLAAREASGGLPARSGLCGGAGVALCLALPGWTATGWKLCRTRPHWLRSPGEADRTRGGGWQGSQVLPAPTGGGKRTGAGDGTAASRTPPTAPDDPCPRAKVTRQTAPAPGPGFTRLLRVRGLPDRRFEPGSASRGRRLRRRQLAVNPLTRPSRQTSPPAGSTFAKPAPGSGRARTGGAGGHRARISGTRRGQAGRSLPPDPVPGTGCGRIAGLSGIGVSRAGQATGRQHRSAYAPDLAGLPVGFCIRDAPLREVRCGQRSLSLPGAAHGHLHAPASSCDWLFLIDGVSRPAGAVSGRLRLPSQKNGFHVPRTLRFLVCTAPLTGPRAVPPSKQPVIPTALVVDRFGPLSGSD